MRTILAAAILPLLTNALDCGSSPPPAAPQANVNVQASASTSATAAPIAATRGGKIVAIGSANVELVVKADGLVEAYPIAAPAAAPAPAAGGSASASLTVVPPTATVDARVSTATGLSAPVRLVWGSRNCFEGRLVNAVPRPGDVEVSVVANGGAAITGRAPAAPIVVVPARGGTIVDVGVNAKAEVVIAKNGVVQFIPIYPTVEAIATVPASATVDADVAVEGGATEHVTFEYRPATFVFEGRVAAGKQVARGATVLHVVNAGARVDVQAPAVEVQPVTALVVDGPQFGGEVVEIEGGAKLEVVADAEGRVVARPIATYITTPRIENGAQISVDVAVVGGARQNVNLVWDDANASFSGRATGNARIVPGPAEVAVVHRPNTPPARGHCRAVAVVPAASLDARLVVVVPTVAVRVDVAGNARANAQAEAERARLEAEAARARLRATVTPPTVRVGVSGNASGSAGGSTSSTTMSSSGSATVSGGVRVGVGGGVRIGR